MKKKITASVISAAASVFTATACAMSSFAEDASSADAGAGNAANPLFTLIIPLGVMLALLYFMAIRPQKKREQEQKTMQDSLRVGDEIVTTGGIVGMVVRVGDDNIVIETGGERNKIRIKKWAIAENVSANERMKEPAKKSALATAAVQEDEPEEKKSGKSKKSKKAEKSEDEE